MYGNKTRIHYIVCQKKMEDSTGIVDMFSQATKYVYMEWLYLLLIYLCLYTIPPPPGGQLVQYFEVTNLYTSLQFCFKNNKSTSTTVAVFKINNVLEKRGYPEALFCDISKTFDCLLLGIHKPKLVAHDMDRTSQNLIIYLLLD
jgi:hypothetical protein